MITIPITQSAVVGRGDRRIHQLQFCKGVTTLSECPGYNTKQSDGQVPVILELWGMWSTSSLPSLPDPLWLGVVAADRILSMRQIELNGTYVKLNCLK